MTAPLTAHDAQPEARGARSDDDADDRYGAVGDACAAVVELAQSSYQARNPPGPRVEASKYHRGRLDAPDAPRIHAMCAR
jgi:hypothetical protein